MSVNHPVSSKQPHLAREAKVTMETLGVSSFQAEKADAKKAYQNWLSIPAPSQLSYSHPTSLYRTFL